MNVRLRNIHSFKMLTDHYHNKTDIYLFHEAVETLLNN